MPLLVLSPFEIKAFKQDQVRVALVGKSFGRVGGIEVPTTQAGGESRPEVLSAFSYMSLFHR